MVFFGNIEPDVGEWFFKNWWLLYFPGCIQLYLEVFLIVTAENGGLGVAGVTSI